MQKEINCLNYSGAKEEDQETEGSKRTKET